MLSICLYNHKGGVSKTTTAFNLGWALSKKNFKVMLVDLDPQCNLTGLILGYMAIDSPREMEIFYNNKENLTVESLVSKAIRQSNSELSGNLFQTKSENLCLLPGHLSIADLDIQIGIALKVGPGIPATIELPHSLPKMIKAIALKNNIDFIIYDLSPSVGGLNEVILMSSDYFLMPTTPDYFCAQAVLSMEKNIKKWQKEIKNFKENTGFGGDFAITNCPIFLGVIQQRYRPRNERPGKSFEEWILKIRKLIQESFVPSLQDMKMCIDHEQFKKVLLDMEPYDLAHIPDFNSLIAISQQLSKPVFDLSNEEIGSVGKTFGYAKNTMITSKDNFNLIFTSLADHIVDLIQYKAK
jgi:chromosome partitioning protein